MRPTIWIKDFVFEQKCIPWTVTKEYCKFRNLVFNINTKKYWDKTWAQTNYAPNESIYRLAIFGQIVKMVPLGSKIVDIGCGIGILMERLKIEKECDVFGVDISKNAIDTIKKNGMDGIVAKVPPVHLPSNSFDVTISTELIEHCTNPRKVLEEMIRITKPCGFLIVTVPDNALLPYEEREHLHMFNEKTLKHIFSKITGVSSVEIFRLKENNENFYRLIAKGQKCQKLVS